MSVSWATPFPFFNKFFRGLMKITVSELIKPLNLSDTWCESKIARINDILSAFAVQCYDLYTMKYSEIFNASNCEVTILTKYPIVRVWGFLGCGCNGCSIKPMDCCEWWAHLLVNQWFPKQLDKNSYWRESEDTANNEIDDDDDRNFKSKWWRIELNLTWSINKWIVIYSRWFPRITKMSDTIEIDPITLSLLRMFIKMEYTLETNNDITMYSYYVKRIESRIEQINKAMGNHIQFVTPGWVQIKWQF